VSPVKYELNFYIPEDAILIATAVKTSTLTRDGPSVLHIRTRPTAQSTNHLQARKYEKGHKVRLLYGAVSYDT
jgi:hypothetical protein